MNRAQEQAAQKQEEVSLWKAAYQAVLDNVALCQQLEGMIGYQDEEKDKAIQALAFPTFGMDPTVLDYVGPRLLQVTDEEKLAQRVNNFRYQIAAHLDPKLNLLREWVPLGDVASSRAKRLIRNLRASIREHVEILIGDARLADDIEQRIQDLK